uniref:J domain-containing protein n=1 Tax=Borely moumouvirus TaxID=2712067 RepID=A0A6G6ACZ8_9VIRU
MSDLETLYQNYLKAKYEYLKKFSEKSIPQFISETKNYVWDKDHSLYECIKFSPIQKPNKNVKKLYKKLSLLCHPDKCTKFWSSEIFQIVNESYLKNDLNKLNELDKYYREHKTFNNYLHGINRLNLSDQIKKIESEVWYIWTSPEADINYRNILKDIFIPVEEYEKRCVERLLKLRKENDELKIQYNELSKLI